MPENDRKQIEDYVKKLINAKNIILCGPPGTGKTYIAREIAKEISGDERTCFVQFHPSYDYTDFIEGLRPVYHPEQKGEICFERMDGVFKRFCRDAYHPKKYYEDTILKLLEKKDGEEIITSVSYNEFCLSYKELFVKELKKFSSDKFDDAQKYILSYKKAEGVFKVKTNNGLNIEIRKKNIISSEGHSLHPFLSLAVSIFLSSHTHDHGLKDNENYCKESWFLDEFVDDLTKYIGDCNSDKQKMDDFCSLYLWFLYNLFLQIEHPKYCFIIDEINRGDLGKIFGELFFSIDPDYRGKNGKVTTQYQNLVPNEDCFAQGFFVPENVYIIGTMNDIDRSVESMDFAIRRRFSFINVPVLLPDGEQNYLRASEQQIAILERRNSFASDKIIKRFEQLNKEIETMLGSGYQIGAGYFKDITKEEDFKDLWSYKLEPLLREYLRGSSDIEERIETLKTSYFDDGPIHGE